MYRYKLEVAYDGGAYYGWQLQAGQRTVQEELESAVCRVSRDSRRALRMQVAGRTDRGVHAAGQVVSFSSNRLFPDAEKLQRSLNSLVPHDISVKAAMRVPADFSARYCTLGKVYHYRIQTSPAVDPFTRHYALHFPFPLDIEAMEVAAEDFLGTHNFAQFSNTSGGEMWERPDPVKTIYRFEIIRVGDGGELCLEVEGSGFLHRMVRHMAGALLAVGNGRLARERIGAALAEGSGGAAEEGAYRGWAAAAAHGLTLQKVFYPPHHDPHQPMFPDLPHDEHGRLAHVPFTWEQQPDGSYHPDLPPHSSTH